MSAANGRLNGRVAIVTGAASGIGKASAIRFASEGAMVVVADVRADPTQRCIDEITALGGTVLALGVDVSDPAQIESMITTTISTFGRLDVLFNNAAITRIGDAVDLAPDDWNLIWNTNVTSIFLAAKFAIPFLRERGGSIISRRQLPASPRIQTKWLTQPPKPQLSVSPAPWPLTMEPKEFGRTASAPESPSPHR